MIRRHQNFHKSGSFLIWILCFAVTFCQKTPKGNDPIRIGCLPVFHSAPWHDLVFAGCIESCLFQLDAQQYRTIPMAWVQESILNDSISDPDYLAGFAKRCGYDLLILAGMDSINPEKISVTMTAYDLRSSKKPASRLEQIIDSKSEDSVFQALIQTGFEKTEIPVSSIPCQCKPISPELARGKYFTLMDDYPSAETVLNRAFLIDKTDDRLRLTLAQVIIEQCIRESSPEAPYNPAFIRAEKILSALADTVQYATDVHKLRAKMDTYRERWNSVENHLRAIWPENDEKQDPDALFLLSRLSAARLKAFGFSNREKLLRRIIRLNPAHQKAWLDLARTCFYHNQMKRSEQVYHEMLHIHPHCLSAWMGLGKLYLVQDRFDDLIVLYEHIIDRWPDSPDVIYNLGLAYYYQQDIDNAIRFFNRAVQIDNHAYSHYFLGVLYLNQNREEDALLHFRACVASHPKKDDPYVALSLKEIRQLTAIENRMSE